MLDYDECNTDNHDWQSYDEHLQGEWLTYNRVASKYAHKAQPQAMKGT